VPGLTRIDPEAIVRGRSVAQGPRGILGLIAGEYPSTEAAPPEGVLAPPSRDVRREMLRMEIEAAEAEAAALRAEAALAAAEQESVEAESADTETGEGESEADDSAEAAEATTAAAGEARPEEPGAP
jgi:hypothetical protein